MEGAELQDGAARAGAHDASGDADAGPGTTQSTPPQPARLGPQPPPRLQSAEEICNIVLALGVKAAAEEGASQGGSAGGGSQEATGAQGEEGVIARGTHLVTAAVAPKKVYMCGVCNTSIISDSCRVQLAERLLGAEQDGAGEGEEGECGPH